jgi:hypothetical protein
MIIVSSAAALGAPQVAMSICFWNWRARFCEPFAYPARGRLALALSYRVR